MRRNLKTQFGTYEVESACYNNGILFVKVVVEYDKDGTPRHPIPYTMNIGGNYELRPGIFPERVIEPREREWDPRHQKKGQKELDIENFLR